MYCIDTRPIVTMSLQWATVTSTSVGRGSRAAVIYVTYGVVWFETGSQPAVSWFTQTALCKSDADTRLLAMIQTGVDGQTTDRRSDYMPRRTHRRRGCSKSGGLRGVYDDDARNSVGAGAWNRRGGSGRERGDALRRVLQVEIVQRYQKTTSETTKPTRGAGERARERDKRGWVCRLPSARSMWQLETVWRRNMTTWCQHLTYAGAEGKTP